MMDHIPVSTIPGIGQAKQLCLAQLGLTTVWELLHHFPIRYEDRRIRPIDGLTEPTPVTVRAVVEGTAAVRWQGRRSVLRVSVRVDNGQLLTAVWFNQHYLREKLTDGRILLISGKLDPGKRTLVASHTEFRISHEPSADFIPVYRVVKGIRSAELSRLIVKALDMYGGQIEEVLPRELVSKYRLCSHAHALDAMHRPGDSASRHQAHRRLAFEEFFVFQVQLQAFRALQKRAAERPVLQIEQAALSTFRNSLPYPLTGAQERVAREILADLLTSHPMVRLLQGDVGAGKTWMALWAAFAVSTAGEQIALMAPTEILAEQHYEEACRRLEPLGLQVEFLTGGTPAKERSRIVTALGNGETDLVVGTHALLTEDVLFANLGLVVVDEQHRFGVTQRELLRDKGNGVHMLMMSATPIPRTLALAVYGDLDVSVLDELPAGRKPIQTYVVKSKDEGKVVRRVRQQLAVGQQAYVVAPLIEESETGQDLSSATELLAHLTEEFAGFTVALLHGRMANAEKDRVMREFAVGSIHVLVSTTVIEVGINVPNATVMMVYNAERFGLAQLHQLRGRVGRGTHESSCYLFSDAAGSGIARERLQTLAESQDGFLIAERDLELRGPGEFLGVRQSGLPEFSVGDIVRDLKVMEVARDEAVTLVSNPDFWLLPKYGRLREVLKAEMSGPRS
ncbi:ATP-dependent DNA helicase RecG [Alicyclobacillus ferrooxydans]|uniref:ATP-dependent DNA helicase RecG n=1 Tax=Alicyclobacillus ferrooxydans TaxID=471514 RepID=A0A0P9D035_9BACL|nr:ATP-dependent DNA helicase RecG [Alicyclobacillus ferrooxydans]KPV45354.1 hypothetical protein AN477_03125 [Alicyclobacillus ferrooxydans]